MNDAIIGGWEGLVNFVKTFNRHITDANIKTRLKNSELETITRI